MKVMLVDDDLLLLEKLKAVVAQGKNLELAGAYADPLKAVEELTAVSPDVLLTDIVMPGMGGVELIAKARELMPKLEIIALTVVEDTGVVLDAIKAGATGYLLKDVSDRELLDALERLDEGGAPLTPRIARAIIVDFRDRTMHTQEILSGREREILQNIEFGMSYKEIAEKLALSHHTVRWHVKNIFEKLSATSKKDALKKARRKGIL